MNYIKVVGDAGITATVIQDSISGCHKRITTFELDYPRFIHAELMTHRMFSRNAASSRAIPVEKMHKNIMENPAMPVVWQRNQAGMQSSVNLTAEEQVKAEDLWHTAKFVAIEASKELLAAGLHKQWANRPTEAFQMMKTIVTATEWDNWYELRNHTDAQPEIHELARVMLQASEESVAMPIGPGEWHVPYVERHRGVYGNMYYGEGKLTEAQALKVSASCCAQVSYRKSDDSLEKAEMVYDRLINSKPMHASPIEHQATPMGRSQTIFDHDRPTSWAKGITNMDRQGRFGSGNFYGWIQHRQLIV